MKAGRLAGRNTLVVAAASPALVLAIGTGCKQDARLADASIKPAVVMDVTDAGLTLDKNASPEMVAFALLRALKDDVEADGDAKAREAAFDRQFRLAAPSAIHQQHIRFVGARHADRDESVYKTVRTWAPTLAYYAAGFGFTFEEAKNAMRTLTVPASSKENLCQAEEKHVLLEAQDPGGDANAAVLVKVRLVREEGRWRVWWVGFDRSRRHLTAARTAPPASETQPAG